MRSRRRRLAHARRRSRRANAAYTLAIRQHVAAGGFYVSMMGIADVSGGTQDTRQQLLRILRNFAAGRRPTFPTGPGPYAVTCELHLPANFEWRYDVARGHVAEEVT